MLIATDRAHIFLRLTRNRLSNRNLLQFARAVEPGGKAPGPLQSHGESLSEKQERQAVNRLKWNLRFIQVYFMLAEFGVQLFVVLVLGLILIGVINLPFFVLLIVSFSLFGAVTFWRYTETRKLIANLFGAFNDFVSFIKEDEDLADLIGDGVQPVKLTKKDIDNFNTGFVWSTILQAFSLLVVLFFVTRIIGSKMVFSGFDLGAWLGNTSSGLATALLLSAGTYVVGTRVRTRSEPAGVSDPLSQPG